MVSCVAGALWLGLDSLAPTLTATVAFRQRHANACGFYYSSRNNPHFFIPFPQAADESADRKAAPACEAANVAPMGAGAAAPALEECGCAMAAEEDEELLLLGAQNAAEEEGASG